jgi:hypothetical protein
VYFDVMFEVEKVVAVNFSSVIIGNLYARGRDVPKSISIVKNKIEATLPSID